MRLEAVILPDLGTGPNVPIVVSHWFAARGERVWEGERLVEVLAGPATFDVPAPVTNITLRPPANLLMHPWVTLFMKVVCDVAVQEPP